MHMTQKTQAGMLKVLDSSGLVIRGTILFVIGLILWLVAVRGYDYLQKPTVEPTHSEQQQENYIDIERLRIADYIQSHRDELATLTAPVVLTTIIPSLPMTEPEDNPQRDALAENWEQRGPQRDALAENWEQRVRRLINQHLVHVDFAGGVYKIRDQQLVCLARNIYFESRGQPLQGQVGVAMVTLNRLDQNYASTICDVVRQRFVANVCQFSWVCKHPNARAGGDAWREAVGIALAALHSRNEIKDPTRGATHFHATYVRPNWGRTYAEVNRIGDHIFYKVRDNR